jgi:hypothetical protein
MRLIKCAVQSEWLYDYVVKKPGMQWPVGIPDSYWASYLNMHIYDMKSGRMSRLGIVPDISGGLIDCCPSGVQGACGTPPRG